MLGSSFESAESIKNFFGNERKGFFQPNKSDEVVNNSFENLGKSFVRGNTELAHLMTRQTQVLTSTRDTLTMIALLLKKGSLGDKNVNKSLVKSIRDAANGGMFGGSAIDLLGAGGAAAGAFAGGKGLAASSKSKGLVRKLYEKYVPTNTRRNLTRFGLKTAKYGKYAGIGLGMLGKVGGAAAGAYGIYDAFGDLRERKDQSFFGQKEGEGGLLGSRAAGYLQAGLSGAAGGAMLGGPWGAAIGAVAGLTTAVISDFGDNIKDYLSSTFDSVKNFFTVTIPRTVIEWGTKASVEVLMMYDSVKTTFTNLKDSVVNGVLGVGQWFKDFFGADLSTKADMLAAVKDGIVDAAKSFFVFVTEKIPEMVRDAWNAFKTKTGEAWSGIKEGAKTAYNRVTKSDLSQSDYNDIKEKYAQIKPISATQGAMIDKIIDLEGGSKITTDTGGLTKYGISKKANPDIDVANLTKEQAVQLYKDRYWKSAGIDNIKNPGMQFSMLNAAVNAGPAKANELLRKSGGDVDKFNALLENHYDSLAKQNPEKYGSSLYGWKNRTAKVQGMSEAFEREANAESKMPDVPKHVDMGNQETKVATAQQQPIIIQAPAAQNSNPVAVVSSIPFMVDDMGLGYLNSTSFN